MKDFDIAKYLKEHNLASYGILNHYVDLKPLKEEEGEKKEVKVGDTLKHKLTATVLKVTGVSGNNITTKVTKSTDKRFKVGDQIKTNKNLIGKTYSLNEDVTPEETAEIPYAGDGKNLTGMGDEDSFEQAETISEDDDYAGAGTFKVEIDWNGDDTAELRNLKRLVRKYDLSVQLLDFEGPAGGAAEVRLTGDRENLIYFIVQVYSPKDPIYGTDMIDAIQQA